jgi:uncharacterized phage protein gp47/JayE
MPVFQPRNRIQILRGMVARVIARSPLVGLTRNSTIYHVLSAAAEEDSITYFEAARLRSVFSIDNATGTDLDERAAEIQPNTVKRFRAIFASGDVTFSRQGTTGTLNIAIGTIIAGSDDKGIIRYKTTAAATILAGNTDITGVTVVALEAGSRGNVEVAAINQFITRVAGVTAVTNPSGLTNGSDRESDERFRARLKAFVAALSRGTLFALESFAANVLLSDGRRVLYSKAVEPIINDGTVQLYIDDGTGTVEEFSTQYITGLDTILASATGGEERLYTAEFPIRDDGTFDLYVNAVLQVRDTDYFLDPTRGLFEFVVPLTAADAVTANYRHFTGLIQEAQRVISGDPDNNTQYPGVQCGGVRTTLRAPQLVLQSIGANIVIGTDFDFATVSGEVSTAILSYFNALNISDPVIVAEIIERAMGVRGMTNFTITTLTGGAAVDQPILSNQVARINSGSIILS